MRDLEVQALKINNYKMNQNDVAFKLTAIFLSIIDRATMPNISATIFVSSLCRETRTQPTNQENFDSIDLG